MKTTLKTLAVALVAVILTACGASNNVNPYTSSYLGTQTSAVGGCVPLQNGSFTFSATGATVYPDAAILAGTLPQQSLQPGAYGTVIMGGTTTAVAGMITYQPKTSANGSIQLNASGNNGAGGTVTGTIQMSGSVINQILSSVGYNYSNTVAGTAQTSICVQSIAIQAAVASNYSSYNTYQTQAGGSGIVSMANVYMTLNSGQTIGPISF